MRRRVIDLLLISYHYDVSLTTSLFFLPSLPMNHPSGVQMLRVSPVFGRSWIMGVDID